MVTCPACGKENEDAAFECRRCRAPLRDEIPEEHAAGQAPAAAVPGGAQVEPEASSDALGMVCNRCEAYNEPGIRTCTNCASPLFGGQPGQPPHDKTPPDGSPSLSDELSALAISDEEAAEAGVSRSGSGRSRSGNGAESEPPFDKTPPEAFVLPDHEEPAPARSRVAEVAAGAATAAGVAVGSAVGLAGLRRSPEPPPAKAPEPAAAPAEKRCPSCGAGNPPAAKFCFDCGTPFAKKPAETKPPEPVKAAGPAPEPVREPVKAAPQPVRAAPPEALRSAPPTARIEPIRFKAEPPPSIQGAPSVQVAPSIHISEELADSTTESTAVESAAVESTLDEPLPDEAAPLDDPLPEELAADSAAPLDEPLPEELPAESAAFAEEPLPEELPAEEAFAEPLPEELPAEEPCEETPPPFQASLVVEKGAAQGTTFVLAHLENSVGGSGAHVELGEDSFIAPHAATLLFAEDHLAVRDEGSANGVFVKVRESAPLEAGDLFIAGERLFRYDGPVELARGDDSETPLLGAPRPQPSAVRISEVLLAGKTGRTCHRAGPVIAIGRTGCDLNFPADALLAARHAEIRLGEDGSATLVDLAAGPSGVFVRLRAQAQQDLQAGDTLMVGEQLLRLEVG